MAGKEVKLFGVIHVTKHFANVKQNLEPFLGKDVVVAIESPGRFITGKHVRLRSSPEVAFFWQSIRRLCKQRESRFINLDKGFRYITQKKEFVPRSEQLLNSIKLARKAILYKENQKQIDTKIIEYLAKYMPYEHKQIKHEKSLDSLDLFRVVAILDNVSRAKFETPEERSECTKLLELKHAYQKVCNELFDFRQLKKTHFEVSEIKSWINKKSKELSELEEKRRQQIYPLRELHWEKAIEEAKPDIIIVGADHLPQIVKIVEKKGYTTKIVMQLSRPKKIRKQIRKSYFYDYKKKMWRRESPKPRKPR